MNKEFEEVKAKLREALVTFVRYAYRTTGDIKSAVVILFVAINDICKSISDSEIYEPEHKEHN